MIGYFINSYFWFIFSYRCFYLWGFTNLLLYGFNTTVQWNVSRFEYIFQLLTSNNSDDFYFTCFYIWNNWLTNILKHIGESNIYYFLNRLKKKRNSDFYFNLLWITRKKKKTRIFKHLKISKLEYKSLPQIEMKQNTRIVILFLI